MTLRRSTTVACRGTLVDADPAGAAVEKGTTCTTRGRRAPRRWAREYRISNSLDSLRRGLIRRHCASLWEGEDGQGASCYFSAAPRCLTYRVGVLSRPGPYHVCRSAWTSQHAGVCPLSGYGLGWFRGGAACASSRCRPRRGRGFFPRRRCSSYVPVVIAASQRDPGSCREIRCRIGHRAGRPRGSRTAKTNGGFREVGRQAGGFTPRDRKERSRMVNPVACHLRVGEGGQASVSTRKDRERGEWALCSTTTVTYCEYEMYAVYSYPGRGCGNSSNGWSRTTWTHGLDGSYDHQDGTGLST